MTSVVTADYLASSGRPNDYLVHRIYTERQLHKNAIKRGHMA